MEIVVGDLTLFDPLDGYASYYDRIQDVKLEMLHYIGKKYPNSEPIFYNLYGKWALLDDVDQLISTYFTGFSVKTGKSPVNSSPVNHQPTILVDNKPVALDFPPLRLIRPDLIYDISPVDANCVLSVEFSTPQGQVRHFRQDSQLDTSILPELADGLLHRHMNAMGALDTLSKLMLERLLKGGDICG